MIVTNIDKLKVECKDASIMEAPAIILKLEEALKNSPTPGIGLAANQIGIKLKIAIIRIGRTKIDLVNPKITKSYDLSEFENEGCLSFPGQNILTKRYNEIVVQGLLNPMGIICVGLEAVAVQHELNHVYGEVMFDYKIRRPKPKEECWCKSGIAYKKCHMRKVIRL